MRERAPDLIGDVKFELHESILSRRILAGDGFLDFTAGMCVTLVPLQELALQELADDAVLSTGVCNAIPFESRALTVRDPRIGSA